MSSGISMVSRSGALTRAVACNVGTELAAFALECTLDRQRADAQRVAEVRGGFFEIDDALGIRLLVDAIDGRDAEAVDASRRRTHWPTSMNSSMRRWAQVAVGAEDALHLAFVIEVDDGLRQVEVDGAALLAFAVEESSPARACARTQARAARIRRGRPRRLREWRGPACRSCAARSG